MSTPNLLPESVTVREIGVIASVLSVSNANLLEISIGSGLNLLECTVPG